MSNSSYETRTESLTTAWVSLPQDDYVVVQISAACRITWGDDDTKYFTYQAGTYTLFGGCRIRAETTANLVWASFIQ